MKVVTPLLITSAMFSNYSVPEADYPEWNAATSYAQGAKVQKAATHRIYQSATANNAGADPALNAAAWTDQGPTNAWSMFDQVVGTRTTATGSITLTFMPGAITALALLDTNANSMRVQVADSHGTVLYDKTASAYLSGGQVVDWYTYYTLPAGKLQTLVLLDLPFFPTGVVTVTITGPDPNGPVSAGTMIAGTWSSLGDTEVGGSVGMLDFSVKATDQFGNTTVTPRAWSKQMHLPMMVDIASMDSVQRQLAMLRTLPVLWLGEDGFDSLAIYGFFKDFQIDLRTAKWVYLSLTVEGLS